MKVGVHAEHIEMCFQEVLSKKPRNDADMTQIVKNVNVETSASGVDRGRAKLKPHVDVKASAVIQSRLSRNAPVRRRTRVVVGCKIMSHDSPICKSANKILQMSIQQMSIEPVTDRNSFSE